MAFKMRGYAYPGKSPVKQGKLGKGKNYESSKGDQQGPIPKNNIKLQPSENPDTYAYKEGDINPWYLKTGSKDKFVEGQRINDLEERKSFIEEDEFSSGKSTKQQKKDKKTLEREAEIMRDRSKNKAGKKSYYANESPAKMCGCGKKKCNC